MKKILLIFVFIILYPLFFIHSVYAITETSGDLQISYDKPLFPPTTVWYPGLLMQKSFMVKNLGQITHIISLQAHHALQTGDLAHYLFFRIDEGAINRYGGTNDVTMKNFWDNGEVQLSEIGPGNTTSYMITISMPDALGNEFQNTYAQFDLVIGFVGTESKITVDSSKTLTQKVLTPTVSLITIPVASRFTPDILGITTQSALLQQTREIKGEKNQVQKQSSWFIVSLVTIGGIGLVLYFRSGR